ncbi:MAG: tRNA (guanosine(37)-N1)-methyltransferase TrmD [bacterium]
MTVHVITLFPDVIDTYVAAGILARARGEGKLLVITWHLRDFATDKHQKVDDYPYGGGAGIILKPDVMARAIRRVLNSVKAGRRERTPVVLTTPHGRPFDNSVAREYSEQQEWIVVCGHYGGVDKRISETLVTDEVSIGDYVLMGGELAAAVMIEAASRFIPGVLGNHASAERDTFEDTLLGPPVYTRPAAFEGRGIPPELLTGNHLEIERWRRRQQLELTLKRRPDLLEKARLTDDDLRYLATLGYKKENLTLAPAKALKRSHSKVSQALK